MRNVSGGRTALVAVAMVIGLASGGRAAEENGAPRPAEGRVSEGENARAGAYWIGLGCRVLDGRRREELKLPADVEGLWVGEVVAGGPGDKAGIEADDVLTEARGRPLATVEDLVAEVEAARDAKLEIKLLRGGEPRTLTVTPAPRPAVDIGPRGLPGDADWEAIRHWLEQMQPGVAPPLRFRFVHPGMILPPGAATLPPLPDDMTVSVTKRGDRPARIVVEQGKNRWEVTESELDKLPANVRAHVERLLGRNLLGEGEMFDLVPDRGRPDGGRPAQPKAAPKSRSLVEDRLDAIERRLDELLRRKAEPPP